MASDKKLWRIGIEQAPHRIVIIAGIATDMFDEHIDILTFEAVQFPIHQSEVPPVAVSTDRPERSELRKAFRHLHRPDISCMPYLVTGFEIMQIFRIPIRMRITDNSDSFHDE